MAYTIEFISGGVTYSIQNYSALVLRRILNDIGEFSITIPSATNDQLANLIEDVEVRITWGNHKLFGFAKNVSFVDSINGLQVSGNSYAIALWDTYTDAVDAYGNMDSSSSGRIVVWVSKTPGAIVYGTTGADGLLKNTIFSAGTINTAGTAGTQRFDNMKKGENIKNLARAAGTEWLDNENKTFDFGNRVGNSTSVKTYQRGVNCTIINQNNSSAAGNVYKIVVLGRGQGVSQISATATAVDYDRTDPKKSKERIYLNNNITDAGVAQAFANSMLAQLNGPLKTYYVQPSYFDDNVQIGDRTTFIDRGGNTHDMRTYEWKLNIAGSAKPTLVLQLIEEGNRIGAPSLNALITQYGALTEIQGSSSQEKSLLVGPITQNASDTNKARVTISLPTDVKTILSAKLYITRQNLEYSTDNTTDNGTQNSSDSGHSGHLIGSYATSGAGGGSVVDASSFVTDSYSFSNSFASGNTYSASSTHTAGMDVYFQAAFAGTSGTTLAEVYVTDGSSNFPSTTGVLCAISTGAGGGSSLFSGMIRVPIDTASKTFTTKVRLVSTAGSETWTMNSSWSTYAQHTHPTTGSSGSGTANISNPAHQNPITQGVYVPGSETNKTIGYAFNGGGETSITNFAVNGDSGEIDVTSAITTAAAQYLDLRPTNAGTKARITASVKITYI